MKKSNHRANSDTIISDPGSKRLIGGIGAPNA
jgi:hypothetical protein